MNRVRLAFGPLTVALLAVPMMLSLGCQGDSPAESAEENKPVLTAQQILQQTVKTYQAAQSYEDSGDLFFVAVADGKQRVDPAIPFSVSFQRPNKLRLHLFGAMLTSDGEKIRAAVTEFGGISGIPGQVLERPAPVTLTDSNYVQDDILRDGMTWGFDEITPLQIELLLADSPLADSLASDQESELLDNKKVNGHDCHRVRLTTRPGQPVLWIDSQSSLLRRVEFSSERLKQKLDPDGQYSSLVARLDLKGAKVEPKLDAKVFTFEVPQGARRLRRFVPPISSPPPRLGELVEGYEFVDLNGKTVDRKSLGEKILVLDFWFTKCAPCQHTLPLMEAVYQKYKDDERIAFLAVSTDPPDVENKQVEATLSDWKVTMPVVRDTRKDSETKFREPRAPALFVLGPDNRIHVYQIGVAENYAPLEQVLDQLLSGKDVARETLAEYAKVRQSFEAELSEASVVAESTMVEILRTEVLPRSESEVFEMTEIWKAADVKEPGNILLVEQEDGDPQILVHDGWTAIAQIDATGKTVERHELPLPDRSVVSFTRTALDQEAGRLFITTAQRQQQVHVYDAQWKHKFSFPDSRHAGIGDACFADLDGDGTLQALIGYWGSVGLHGVSLEGERQWSNRDMANVLQVTALPPDEKGKQAVFCLTTRGTLRPIDSQGKPLPEIRVPGRALTSLAAADFAGDGTASLCALAAIPGEEGKVVAVGLDRQGKELWSYELPAGYHETPVERIVAARLSEDDAGWLLPAADGSIHLLTPEGDLVDRFNYGAALRGLALGAFEDGPLLLVSTSESLIAWKVSPRQ